MLDASPSLVIPPGYEPRLDLTPAATSKLLKDQSVHRWFFFPHSYSPQLVDAILDRWMLPEGGWLLDPFVGAGTTLLAAQSRGINGVGVDLSPLAVRVSRAKTAHYDWDAAESSFLSLERCLLNETGAALGASGRLARAFTETEYAAITRIRMALRRLDEPFAELYLLALLVAARNFSRAVSDGGWYRWVDKPDRGSEVIPSFLETAAVMIEEIRTFPRQSAICETRLGDARSVHVLGRTFDAIVTSPPYPNRHDYTRVYHIELLLLGYTEAEIFEMRYRALRSHVEAKPPLSDTVTSAKGAPYAIPPTLGSELSSLPPDSDPRVRAMLRGYFEDLHYTLAACSQALRPGGKAAFVIGNARHNGVMFHCDQILAELSVNAGLEWQGTWIIRVRGNSAQQMGRHGREPSRESVVFFAKPQVS